MDALTAAQIFLSVSLLYAIYSKKSMPLIGELHRQLNYRASDYEA